MVINQKMIEIFLSVFIKHTEIVDSGHEWPETVQVNMFKPKNLWYSFYRS